MKEYAFIILIFATAITLVAAVAGIIAYLQARYGKDSLTFQLDRIGVMWVGAILLLLLGGLFFATVTDWTKASLGDAILWLRAHNVINNALTWARANRMMASIFLWNASFLVTFFIHKLNIFTRINFIIIGTIHLWCTYLTWLSPVWLLIKAVIATIVFIALLDEGIFHDSQKYHAKTTPPPTEHSSTNDESAAPTSSDTTTHQVIWQRQGPDSNPSPTTPQPHEVISKIINDCADAVADTAK